MNRASKSSGITSSMLTMTKEEPIRVESIHAESEVTTSGTPFSHTPGTKTLYDWTFSPTTVWYSNHVDTKVRKLESYIKNRPSASRLRNLDFTYADVKTYEDTSSSSDSVMIKPETPRTYVSTTTVTIETTSTTPRPSDSPNPATYNNQNQ